MDISEVVLSPGGHSWRDDGVCAMEAVAWLAGEKHTATPQCVSDPLARFIIKFNDYGSQEDRDNLRPYLPYLIGTADRDGKGDDHARHYWDGVLWDGMRKELCQLRGAIQEIAEQIGNGWWHHPKVKHLQARQREIVFAKLNELFGEQMRQDQEQKELVYA